MTEQAPQGRDALPRRTTPTWEMELLISGATVFALLQLPGAVDELLYRHLPRLDQRTAGVAITPYLYVMTATYALIATFILHLAARGYWVALVGLRSVHPDGVRWDAMRWGPNYRAAVKEGADDLDALVERADNRASLVFGYGIGFALLMLAPLLLVLLLSLVAMFLHWLLGGHLSWAAIWMTLFGLLTLPFAATVLWDRRYGAAATGTRRAEAARRLFRAYLHLGFSSFVSYPMLMFVSRMGERRGNVAMTLTMLALILAVVAQFQLRESGLPFHGYAWLPEAEVGSKRALQPDYYADRRDPGSSLVPFPYIDSELSSGAWLRVFIPYRPGRDTPHLEALCPEHDAADEGSRDEVMLRCLALLYRIRIDGIEQDVELDASEDPATGHRGVVAMLSVAGLDPGRHLLEIERAPRPETPSDAPAPHRIPFWR